jgi:hypothetical protein
MALTNGSGSGSCCFSSLTFKTPTTTFLLITFSDPDPQHWLKKGYYPKDDFIDHGVQYILSGQLQQSGVLL